MATLDSLLVPGAVDLHGTAKDWRAAIHLAGSLLEEAGTITADYTEAMVHSVEETGPYIVVAPGFAFAHARPSEAVKETSLSWVRLDKPVEFGHDSNDPVDLVVAFAARSDSELDRAESEEELRAVLTASTSSKKRAASTATSGPKAQPAKQTAADSVASKGKILTVCGNGLGTSLFLKNTLEQVLDEWGWGPYLTVEATDTISAKGRAGEADFLLTSGEIAATLGDVGVPVYVIQDFTSMPEIDGALRELYDI